MAVQSSFKNMSLCLLVICLVCSALLAGVYALTADPIAKAAQAKNEAGAFQDMLHGDILLRPGNAPARSGRYQMHRANRISYPA